MPPGTLTPFIQTVGSASDEAERLRMQQALQMYMAAMKAGGNITFDNGSRDPAFKSDQQWGNNAGVMFPKDPSSTNSNASGAMFPKDPSSTNSNASGAMFPKAEKPVAEKADTRYSDLMKRNRDMSKSLYDDAVSQGDTETLQKLAKITDDMNFAEALNKPYDATPDLWNTSIDFAGRKTAAKTGKEQSDVIAKGSAEGLKAREALTKRFQENVNWKRQDRPRETFHKEVLVPAQENLALLNDYYSKQVSLIKKGDPLYDDIFTQAADDKLTYGTPIPVEREQLMNLFGGASGFERKLSDAKKARDEAMGAWNDKPTDEELLQAEKGMFDRIVSGPQMLTRMQEAPTEDDIQFIRKLRGDDGDEEQMMAEKYFMELGIDPKAVLKIANTKGELFE